MRTWIIILLAFVAADLYAQADRKFIRKGNGDFKEGQYQQAEVEYRKALEKNPASYKADYNLGNALYKQKQFDAAAAKYSALAGKEADREKLSRYFYNLGNTMYETQKYKESIEAYKMALRNNPADMDAKHNLQLALRMLTEQQQQQNRQGKDNEDQQDQDKKEQNKDQQQDQNAQNQDPQGNKGEQEEEQQPRPTNDQISPEDAERILQALENEEKEVMKRIQDRKEQVRKEPVDKNW